MNALTHLHIHSEFSLSDSILRVGEIVDFAKSQGAEAIALTDRNNLYGALKFYKKARAAGIKPILGCDLTVRDSDGTDNQLILLAQNLKGFIHLCELVSFAYQYDQDHQGVAVHIERFTPTQCEGLLALSGGIDGDLARFLRRRDAQGAEKRAAFWQGIFPDRYYLQLARRSISTGAATPDANWVSPPLPPTSPVSRRRTITTCTRCASASATAGCAPTTSARAISRRNTTSPAMR